MTNIVFEYGDDSFRRVELIVLDNSILHKCDAAIYQAKYDPLLEIFVRL